MCPERAALALYEFTNGRLLDNPRRMGSPLGEPYEGELSAHVGSWRVIYRVDDEAFMVKVVGVGHRAHVYGHLSGGRG